MTGRGPAQPIITRCLKRWRHCGHSRSHSGTWHGRVETPTVLVTPDGRGHPSTGEQEQCSEAGQNHPSSGCTGCKAPAATSSKGCPIEATYFFQAWGIAPSRGYMGRALRVVAGQGASQGVAVLEALGRLPADAGGIDDFRGKADFRVRFWSPHVGVHGAERRTAAPVQRGLPKPLL